MQTILGINGITGKGIANELIQKGYAVKGVSRRPTPGPWTHVVADILQKDQITAAIAGSEVVYACFGLEYTPLSGNGTGRLRSTMSLVPVWPPMQNLFLLTMCTCTDRSRA